jgi:hypothetical protein
MIENECLKQEFMRASSPWTVLLQFLLKFYAEDLIVIEAQPYG